MGVAGCEHKVIYTIKALNDGAFVSQSDPSKYRSYFIVASPDFTKYGASFDPDDPSTLISVLSLEEARDLIDKGIIGGGMIPKIKNCVEAVEQGVSRVHILDGRREHCLLLEFFTRKGIGTAIIDNKVNLYPHENEWRLL